MSTEIKPGQVWAWNDTEAAKGPHGSQFEIVNAAPHVLDVAYQYPHAAGFDPERVYASRAELVAANAVLIRCSCRAGTEDTCDQHSATPAPLDPTLVQAGKAPEPGDTLVWTNSGIEVRVTELTPAAVVFAWSNGAVGQLPWSEWFNYLQPAPKPEWKPGTSGTATALHTSNVHGFCHLAGPDISDTFAFTSDEGVTVPWRDVVCFVPDETRPLPGWRKIRDALREGTAAAYPGSVEKPWSDIDETTLHHYDQMATAVEALLRGESR